MKACLLIIIAFSAFSLIFTGIIPCLLAEKSGNFEGKAQSIKYIFIDGTLLVFSLLMSLLT